MILADKKIIWYCENQIFEMIKPFDVENVNPASIDLRWSGKVTKMKPNGSWGEIFDLNSVIIEPNGFYLMDTLEFIQVPPNIVGKLFLKSTFARMGMEHSHACFFDPGFHGTATLEISNISPASFKIKRGQRICQMSFEETSCFPDKLYEQRSGHYQGQKEPTKAWSQE